LRSYILRRCKIVEILLTDPKHFEGVGFQFAGMTITTLEKCSEAKARQNNVMRLVDYIRDPADFASPSREQVTDLRQSDYEILPETPFFVGVPNELFASARGSLRVGEIAKGRVGLQTGEDKRFLAGIGASFPGLEKIVSTRDIAVEVDASQKEEGIKPSNSHWVPFAKGEGFGEYWRPPQIAIDWSEAAVNELERRAALPAGTSRKTYFRNREFFFRPALTYSVVSSGRISARLMPSGWIFGHKGSAIFTEDEDISELFLLGYLNSALATYFMKKLVNTTATADIGYIEKLPFRKPEAKAEKAVVKRVEQIIEALKADPGADVSKLRSEIDELIFDLFEIHDSREEVLRFYDSVGRVEKGDAAQEASE
jgi:hypothetical protein